MKTVYKATNHIITIYFKDGTSISKDFADSFHGRFKYQYGELPKNEFEEYTGTEDEVWAALLKRSNYTDKYKGDVTIFKKRRYLPDVNIDLIWINKRIYKDELLKFTIEIKYKDYSNNLPSIETLEKDLGFKDYSEFVFMREQELKSMLLKNS